MKSAVCKKANELIKKGYNRSQAFKKAWYIVRFTVVASEIKKGTTIRMEYGDYNNKVECTVVSKSNDLFLGKYYIINAVTKSGLNMEFCAKSEELFDLAA